MPIGFRRAAVSLAVVVCGAAANAQDPVLLRLHPHVGDTLHTLLEQQTDVSDVTPGSPTSPARAMTSTVVIFSETIVRAVSARGTTVLTIVDSAKMSSTDPHAAQQIFAAQRALEGQHMTLELGADGSVESARDARGVLVTRDVAAAMSAMPAVFPRQPVRVGDQWTREMPLPPSAPGARSSARARAVFRLDSLQKDGSTAYVSMHGDIATDSTGTSAPLSGSIAGTLKLDRVRGWMTESRFLIMLKSLVTPPAGSGFAPMHVFTRVQQHMRTMDKH